MNSNAQKWVAALRSGAYDQAQEGLQTETGYCCLGVACDLYMKDTGLGKWLPPAAWEEDEERDADSHQDWFYAFESDYVDEAAMSLDSFTLSNVVKDWLGLNSADGKFEDKDRGLDSTLTAMNDNGYTFADIADTIEQNEDLFVWPYEG